MLKYALLGFLNYQPMTGYEIKQMIDVSTANFWHAKQSQIYTTLKKLEADNLAVSHVEAQEGRPDRRVYNITETGRVDLRTWLAQPLRDLQPKKELLLLKLFFSANIDKRAMLAQLHLHRGMHQQQAEHYQTESKAVIQQIAASTGLAQDALLWDATRRFGELYEEMYLRWLDDVIVLIEEKF